MVAKILVSGWYPVNNPIFAAQDRVYLRSNIEVGVAFVRTTKDGDYIITTGEGVIVPLENVEIIVN